MQSKVLGISWIVAILIAAAVPAQAQTPSDSTPKETARDFAASARSPFPVTGPLANEMNALLELQPGGVQVSMNAMVWGDGDTVIVWPSPGSSFAPLGLGANIRRDRLKAIDAEFLAPTTLRARASLKDTQGCPGGVFVQDYYCFYVDRDFGGRRLQFSETTIGNAGDWGFNNQTSSWVMNDVDKNLEACDTGQFVGILWYMPENSSSSYVGAANNDKMSSWGKYPRCTP